MSKLSTILSAAADLLERDGWCQHVTKWEGKRCVAMAISDAIDPGPSLDLEGQRLYDQGIRACERQIPGAVTIWNDARGRTVEQVCRMLRRAAEAVAPQGSKA